METYDLVIIGSGSGNAIPAELADWKIALVERGVFGGTCLNVGCIPSKMFVLPADVALAAGHSERLGLDTSFNGVDWPAIRDRVFGRIDPIAAAGEEYRATGTPNVELIKGTARFVGDREFDVDGRRISGTRVLVANGSRAVQPPIPGLAETRHHTSDTVMRLDRLPERLAVIGGGFIAAELGHVFDAYGSQVTLFNRSAGLLRGQDEEVAERFAEVFGRRVDLRLGHVPERIEEVDGAIRIHVGDEVVEVDELLVATGRTPNSDLIDAAAGGLDVHEDGRVVIDEHMATSVDGVWAIGDIANPFQLKHLANAEAKVAFNNIAADAAGSAERQSVDYRAIPSAVFSNPQVATVGLTEQEARDRGLDFVVGKRDYGGTAYGWAMEDSDSFAKVLIDRGSGLLLGAHLIGSQAASLIQPLIQAMQFDQPARKLAEDVFYIHPALTEVVENALLDGLEKLDSD